MRMMLASWFGHMRFAAVLAAACAFAFVAVGTPTPAVADNATLKKIDKKINLWKTLDYRYSIVTKDSDGKKSKLKLRMKMRRKKGNNQQLIHITEPADMKGTKVLTLSPTEMYIYLPQYNKIRRIASHVTEQGFLGTALSQRDMTLTRYADKYNATTKSTGENTITLTLTAKDDTAPYPKLELVVSKKKLLPKKIRYFNEDGKQIKEERRSGYKCKKKYCAPTTMVMEDKTNGKTTKLTLKKWKVDPKIKKGTFSKRSLK